MANRAQLAVRVKGQKKCHVHKDNDVIFVCKTCDVLICTTCILSSHKLHFDSFSELSKIKKEKTNIITDFINDTENVNIPKLNEEITSSRTKLLLCKTEYEKRRKNVIENTEKCKKELDEIAAQYVSIYNKMEVADTDLIQTHITDLERRLDTLNKLSSEYKQTLQTGTEVLVYDSVSEIRELDPNIPPTPNIKIAEFTPGMERLSHLKQALGNMELPTDHLQAGSASGGHSDQRPVVRPKQSTEAGQASSREVRYKLRDRPKVKYQFSYPDHITSICPTSDGCAWLCYYDTNTVNLINKKGRVIQTIQHNSVIQDISLDPTTGRLWFCCFRDNTICEVSTPYTTVTRFYTDDYPASLCVTREGRVVVGTRDYIQGYKVVMYTIDGQVLHTHIEEGSGTGFVKSISQCSVTGNIAAVAGKHIGGGSISSNFRRLIIVFSPTLQPLVHYRGEGIEDQWEGKQEQKSVTPDKFGASTVVYDSKGNIVIADKTRNTIELISGAGKYIKTLHTNKGEQGVVGIQKGDVLWSNLELDTGGWGLKLLKYYSD
ncbi:uncharacterized protein LOC117333746 [Pecten maximus]|uniref:uncharacterized protein LOC117333746 n=1 Tax=Pecten maximus TaxID=6579 RepID=UPI001458FB89|nr:uncharacterized protein LOC117333746 [Pecten maximus]